MSLQIEFIKGMIYLSVGSYHLKLDMNNNGMHLSRIVEPWSWGLNVHEVGGAAGDDTHKDCFWNRFQGQVGCCSRA